MFAYLWQNNCELDDKRRPVCLRHGLNAMKECGRGAVKCEQEYDLCDGVC